MELATLPEVLEAVPVPAVAVYQLYRLPMYLEAVSGAPVVLIVELELAEVGCAQAEPLS